MDKEIATTSISNLEQEDWDRRRDVFTQSSKSLLKRLGWQGGSLLSWALSNNSEPFLERLREQQSLLKVSIGIDSANSFVERSVSWKNGGEHGFELLEAAQVAYGVDLLAHSLTADKLQTLLVNANQLAKRVQQATPHPWLQQLAAVELPLVIAVQLGRSAKAEILQMETMIGELVDGDGWIVAKNHRDFGALLSSWARCVRLIAETQESLEDSIAIKLEWMARQWLRLMRPDGTILLGPDGVDGTDKDMQAAILALSSDREDKKLAQLRIGIQKSKTVDGNVSRLHDGAGFSEWAGLGVFQCGWSRFSPRLAMAIEASGVQLELANRRSLVKGAWDVSIAVDGEPVDFCMSDYEINCYHSDEEVEFIELEYKSDQEAVLQRQIMLARDEQFLLLADAVVLKDSAKIDYSSTLPLAKRVIPLLETDNREIYLKDWDIHSLVLPLALGEWRSDRLPGDLNVVDGRLNLQQQGQGTALYAPLFFDLSPVRCTSPRTWRNLTVAEELKILARDKAVAYRIQIGEQQWVIYRSLSGIASRTFFGENQICEFFVGKTDGDVGADELIQIE